MYLLLSLTFYENKKEERNELQMNKKDEPV